MAQNDFRLLSSAVSDRGLSEKRPHNEDSYLEMPERGLFVVADGVGGAQAGDVASQMAAEILSEAFTNLPTGGDVEDLMKLAITRANASIYQMSQELPQLSTMATTIVSLHLADNIATIGHVGDSRLYRLDSRGQLLRETQDHSVVEEEVRAGRMTPEQAANHPSKNVISRALGAESSVEVDMKTIMFEPNTTFLLCSDGVTRHISDDEISALLKSSQNLSEICGKIKEICYSRGAEDNLTAVIVKVGGENIAAVADNDLEEHTVAAARAPLVNSAILSKTAAEEDESKTADLIDKSSNKDDEFLTADRIGQPLTVETAPVKTVSAEPSFEIRERKSGSGLLMLLPGLLLGAALGAGGVYYWLTNQPKPEVPVITKVETPNIPYSAFEDNRRNVDKNPAQYISASGANPQDAEDYYLLGRAYALTGRYDEAKTAFQQARSFLPSMQGSDRTMLANEIAIATAAIEPASRKIFETEKITPGNTAANTAANSISNTANVNSAANSNADSNAGNVNSGAGNTGNVITDN